MLGKGAPAEGKDIQEEIYQQIEEVERISQIVEVQ